MTASVERARHAMAEFFITADMIITMWERGQLDGDKAMRYLQAFHAEARAQSKLRPLNDLPLV